MADCISVGERTYNQDGLITMHGTSFANEPAFVDAYQAARATDSWFGGDLHWRMHVLVWAATNALNMKGDFVECGSNRGGSALMLVKYLGTKARGRPFYLFDTFCGMDARLSLKHEMDHYEGRYPECYEQVVKLFKPYSNVHVVRGSVPDTLIAAHIDHVAFLHIDMNAAKPERAALEYFWPKLVQGGIVIFDDYNWVFCKSQKDTIDEFARSIGQSILCLPTGQGMLFKTKS